MFLPRPHQITPPQDVAYQLDGHEFVCIPGTGAVACRNCDQDSSELAVASAIASGREGVFPECGPPQLLVIDDRCLICNRELSRTYLDFYAGRDPLEKDMCRDCRARRSKLTLDIPNLDF
jgi:hypothetical protein